MMTLLKIKFASRRAARLTTVCACIGFLALAGCGSDDSEGSENAENNGGIPTESPTDENVEWAIQVTGDHEFEATRMIDESTWPDAAPTTVSAGDERRIVLHHTEIEPGPIGESTHVKVQLSVDSEEGVPINEWEAFAGSIEIGTSASDEDFTFEERFNFGVFAPESELNVDLYEINTDLGAKSARGIFEGRFVSEDDPEVAINVTGQFDFEQPAQ